MVRVICTRVFWCRYLIRSGCDLVGFDSAARGPRAPRALLAIRLRSAAGGTSLYLAALAALHARSHRPAALLSFVSGQLRHLGNIPRLQYM